MAVNDEVRLRSDTLTWREVEGEIVALDLGASAYLGVNRTGAVLWRELAAGTTRYRLASRLRAEFEIDEETAVRDVDQFLKALDEHELLAK